MKNIIFSYWILLLSSCIFSQNAPKVTAGKLERIPSFQSKFVTQRNIDIWLPDNYSTSKKYSVLYIHDGQMLFDATTTWNKQAWEVDEVMAKLLKENTIQEVIGTAVLRDTPTIFRKSLSKV
jgi:enterochelin esterase-like enzyme